jgi:hypothetical protein
MADDRRPSLDDPSPGSPLRFNARRLVGGARLLLTEASPHRLLFQRRIRNLKAELVADTTEWEGIEARPHRFGGTEFVLDGREIGHVHEWGLVDIPFVAPLGEAVREAGLATRHHVLPDSGWATTFLETDADCDRIRDLYRLSYCWHCAMFAPTILSRDAAVEEVHSLGFPNGVAEAFETTLRERGAGAGTATDQ